MRPQGRATRGNAVLEFTLVGIPLMFVLISTYEMARGMWIYHTLAYAARAGTRFVAVKGTDCALGTNTCAVTVQQVAQRIQFAGLGLDAAQLNVRFVSSSRSIPASGYTTLQAALSNTTYWPTSAPGGPADFGGDPGQNIQISLTYPFQSAMAFFWPGKTGGMTFGTFTLPASSQESIQF